MKNVYIHLPDDVELSYGIPNKVVLVKDHESPKTNGYRFLIFQNEENKPRGVEVKCNFSLPIDQGEVNFIIRTIYEFSKINNDFTSIRFIYTNKIEKKNFTVHSYNDDNKKHVEVYDKNLTDIFYQFYLNRKKEYYRKIEIQQMKEILKEEARKIIHLCENTEFDKQYSSNFDKVSQYLSRLKKINKFLLDGDDKK